MKPDYEKVPIKQFRRMVAKRAKVNIPETERVIDAFWSLIHDAMVAKRRVCIPGIGEFYASPVGGGKIIRGYDGEMYLTKPKYRVIFSSSKIWRLKVAKEMGEPDEFK